MVECHIIHVGPARKAVVGEFRSPSTSGSEDEPEKRQDSQSKATAKMSHNRPMPTAKGMTGIFRKIFCT
jgi:hypothetical protein